VHTPTHMIRVSALILALSLCACTHKPPGFEQHITKKGSCTTCTHTLSSLPEKHIVVIIPSYNNSAWYRHTLTSLTRQKYKNFHVYYIDDCSTDGTGVYVKRYLKRHHITYITLIQNTTRRGSLANIWHVIQQCSPDDIVIHLDGDDWLAHNHVLKTINTMYQTHNVWLTYGQFKNWPTQKIGWCKPTPLDVIQHNTFREFGFWYAQPRTHYAWLAQKINPKDLIDPHTHTFYSVAGDVALMFPMIEMAGTHSMCSNDILYYRNVQTPLNDFKLYPQEQIAITTHLQQQKKYLPLEKTG
jgi:glycosyltransferase involved in cell wall biosynthesis